MTQRTYGATSRTCVHTLIDVASVLFTIGRLKILFVPLYLFVLAFFLPTNITLIHGREADHFFEEGTVPQVDIQLQPPKRWKASSASLGFIRQSLRNYIAKEIAAQRPRLLSRHGNKTNRAQSLIVDGQIVKQ
ncbi:hypothetical protein BMR1_02g02445 [Babesia microti strain RI]|uniref:Uncharacterized protein n=1 Tax=Babesia microti (strain RI) TaxID=1133968 RepID=A0A1R4AAJ0_BABMR|nr:hypothetical protein BMR1_02g02445 [Babesia microti strain RI]SJK86000.1 hypothetical protein BMR1_02g02445 [Babesia microti strain RI]|eukprot:XP_021338199.1 hypothetical protein BMR1_02g02445 [Babesia microti strain RI]